MNRSKNENNPEGTDGQASCAATEQAPAVDAAIQGALGRKLRESYDEVVKEAVPQKFLDLLETLKHKEKGAKGGDT